MTNTELAALAQQAVAEGKPITKIPSGRRSRGRIETDDRQYETPVFEPTAPQPNPDAAPQPNPDAAPQPNPDAFPGGIPTTARLVWVAPNPKKPGSKSHARYALYPVLSNERTWTLEQVLRECKGGPRTDDFLWDVRKGFIKVVR